MAGQTYDPYAVFADAPAPTPDLSQIPQRSFRRCSTRAGQPMRQALVLPQARPGSSTISLRRDPPASLSLASLSEQTTDDLVLFAFDLLFDAGADLRTMPLSERKERLQVLVNAQEGNGRSLIRFVEHFGTGGDAVLKSACRLSLEGIVSKRLDSVYVSGQGRCSMPRALKVYQTQIGFYDLVVAAPSQAAALRAWGTHLNMFADGSAHIATDEQAIKAALAQPETPLKRGVGTNDPFSLNPRLPRIADLPSGEKKATAKRQPVKSKPKPPDRRALDDAEAALQRISDARRTQESSYAKQYAELQDEQEQLRKRRAAIEAEEAATKLHFDAAALRAEKALQRERQAFTRAGGDPDAS